MQSNLILAKNINMDKNYKNVTSLSNTQMLSLLRSNDHIVGEWNDYNFIKRGQISVQVPYDTVLRSNYLAFQNKDYTNKWFFAWIDNVEFINPNTTRITYTEDVWTTWHDDWTAKQCYVVREHVNDDTVGANTIPENLAVEEVVQENVVAESAVYGWLNGDVYSGYYIVMETNWLIKPGSTGSILPDYIVTDRDGTQFDGLSIRNNIVSGNGYVIFPINSIEYFNNVEQYIRRTNFDRHIEDIKNIYVVPRVVIQDSSLTSHVAYVGTVSESTAFTYYTFNNSTTTPIIFATTINKITSFSDYTPKNNKCFVYPYNYILLSNNNGSHNIYKYENFSTENCVFANQLALTKGVSGRIVPVNYKGMDFADDESIAIGKYPLASWSSDAYINWLTTTGVNSVTKLALGALGAAAGIGLIVATGGAAAAGAAAVSETALAGAAGSAVANTGVAIGSAAISTATNIGSTIGEFNQAKLLPNIEGGQATGDVLWSVNKNVPTFRQMRAKTEYLRIIDEYFTRFGYKVNRLKVPNLSGRSRFNYVEINKGEDIVNGNVPVKYLEAINTICSNGVTIWHNHDAIGDYLTANNIL